MKELFANITLFVATILFVFSYFGSKPYDGIIRDVDLKERVLNVSIAVLVILGMASCCFAILFFMME